MKNLLKALMLTSVLSLSTSLYAKDITIKTDNTSTVIHHAIDKDAHTYIPLEDGLKLFNGTLLTQEDTLSTFMLPFAKTGDILVCIEPNELFCTYKVVDPTIGYEGATHSSTLTYMPFYENDELYISLVDLSIFNLKTASYQNGIYYLLDATASSL